jgi:hypothetical protein
MFEYRYQSSGSIDRPEQINKTFRTLSLSHKLPILQKTHPLFLAIAYGLLKMAQADPIYNMTETET